MQWFYADAQRVQHGPMGAAELLAAFNAGKFKPDSLVWREGMSDWRPFSQFATEFGLDEDDLYPGQVGGSEMNLTQMSEPIRRVDDNPYAAPSAPLSDSMHAAMGEHEVVYAGFWKRFAALFLDNLILSVASYAILIPLVVVMGMGDLFIQPNNPSADLSAAQLGLLGIMYLIYPTISFLYFVLLESGSAQASLGKRVVGIKVCTLDGRRMSFANAAGRWFATLLSYLTLYIGFAMAGLTQRKQALHDMIGSTLVVDQYAFTHQAHLQRRELGGCAITMIVIFGAGILLMVLGIVLAIAIPAMAGAA